MRQDHTPFARLRSLRYLAGIYSNDDETGTPMEWPDEFAGLALKTITHHSGDRGPRYLQIERKIRAVVKFDLSDRIPLVE